MDSFPLFRQEVLLHTQQRQFGHVFINMPVSYRVCVLGFMLVSLSLVLLVVSTTFTEKCEVKGYLNAATGVIHVHARQSGIIKQAYVSEGDTVKAGDVLYRIDTSPSGSSIKQREKQLLLARQKKLNMAWVQKQAVVKQLKPLLMQHYIAQVEYQARVDELTVLSQQRMQLAQALIHYQQMRTDVVRAPREGVVSNPIQSVGQYIKATQPLLTLIPQSTPWVAELFIPMASARFIKLNQVITLRYDAYPYQQFGGVSAVIQSIGRVVVNRAEQAAPLHIDPPYYKVTAYLVNQRMRAYGEWQRLQQGMTLTAIIPGAKKPVWRWIIDPLYHGYQEWRS